MAPTTPLRLLVAGGLVLLAAGGSTSGDDAPAATPIRPAQPAIGGEPVTVYLSTALACANVPLQAARFEPLTVGHVEAEQIEGCQEQQVFSTYVYTVRVPSGGQVTVTPGNQPAATFDAAQARSAGWVTIHYAREGEWQYAPSSKQYGSSIAE